MRKLLTIAVPTYNRFNELQLLLHTLCEELVGYESLIELIVSDNASTDRTDVVVQQFKKSFPSVRTIRHMTNVGMDANFCSCIELATGRFFWMLGDDDLPKKGVLPQIVQILQGKNPDLLYLNSEWMSHITSADNGELITTLTAKALSRENFARQVNVWVTFISGMIVNLERMQELNPGFNIRRFAGTSLVHLGWILPLLLGGNRFYFVAQRCVLAKAGNTGGYALIAVFASNLDHLLVGVPDTRSSATLFIARYNRLVYLPRLLWNSRFGYLGKFDCENLVESLSAQRSRLVYWILLLPIAVLPRPLATGMLSLSRGVRVILHIWTQTRQLICTTIGTISDVCERGVRKFRRFVNRMRGLTVQPFLAECRGSVSLGEGVTILGRRNISCLGPFIAMNRNRIEAYERHGNQRYSPTIMFGANVSMEDDCHIGAIDRIELHDNVMLASKVYISDHSHGTTSLNDLRIPPNLRPLVSKGAVVIESDVWIGEGVAVLPGVRIGRGSVIGANAVVTRDIPPYSTAAGSPARVIARRSLPTAVGFAPSSKNERFVSTLLATGDSPIN